MAVEQSIKTCTRCGTSKPISEFPLCRGEPRARCRPCHSKDTIAWQRNNLEKYRLKTKKWRSVNDQPRFMGPPLPEHEKKRRALANSKRWREGNKEVFDAMRKAWSDKNPHKRFAITRRYQARKLQACPAWANHFFIEEIYDLRIRREIALGIKFDVDHIVPLKSRLVCGLHVEHNLRVIPSSVNRAKSNSHWPDMP